jgi:hypothetical protein
MQLQMVVTSGAALVALLVAIGLSVYKPQGMTTYDWRKQRQLVQREGERLDRHGERGTIWHADQNIDANQPGLHKAPTHRILLP